jgi:Tfp pilus assembly protein PilX
MTRIIPRHKNRPKIDRRAVVLVSVLVCLAVAMTMFLAWLKTAALERRQLQARQDRVQAEILADAGLDRAAAQLLSAGSYSAETWQIGAESLAGRGAATVTIRVESVPENATARIVHAVADYPVGREERVRRSKQITVVLPKTGEAP